MSRYKPRKIDSMKRIYKNYFIQGLFYMDKTERIMKIIVELLLIVILIIVFNAIINNAFIPVLLAVIIAHTINWFLNGSVYMLWLDEHLIKLPKNPIEIKLKYIDRLNRKIKDNDFIIFAGIYGSICRGDLHERSDIDLRLVRKKGMLNAIKVYFFILNERMYCQFNRTPLCSGYFGDDISFVYKMSKDEKPIVLINNCTEYPYSVDINPIQTIKNINSITN